MNTLLLALPLLLAPRSDDGVRDRFLALQRTIPEVLVPA